MSTKYFLWDGGTAAAVGVVKYVEGAPMEYGITDRPMLAIQGWHGIPPGPRTALTARLIAAGWIEGDQSKPDK